MSYPFRNQSLPLHERVQSLLGELTLEEKIALLPSRMAAVPRLGIGEWKVGCEVARGYVTQKDGGRQDVSTVFPQPIGMASMFDPELMYRIGEIAGDEARFYYQKHKDGCLMVWGPTVDMERNPLWGRTEEAYGEDPFLTGEMTKNYTRAMAGDDEFYLKTVPTLKHFCANNNEKDRGSCSANVDPRTLHEYYYQAFKPAITEGKAFSIMAAYNELSGVPAIMNPDIQRLLKDEWGLDYVVADGGDFAQNLLLHKCVKTHAEALALCIRSGVDSMTEYTTDMVIAAAKYGLEHGILTEADVDRAVGNVLKGRFRLGEFDECHPYKDMQVTPESESSRKVNYEAALKQVCLLKNNGILPLKKPAKIALIGPHANQNYRDWYTGLSTYDTTVLDGLAAEYGAENILFDNGYDIVTLKSALNDKYLAVDLNDENKVKAVSENAGDSAQFERHDWGRNEVNFKAVCNNLYVTEDGEYKAVSPFPYSWFIKEWFKPFFEKHGGLWSFRSWRDREMDIYLDEDCTLTMKPASRLAPEMQFRQEVISSGIERAAKLAKECDIAIVCVGNHPMQVARECYDREDLELPAHQSNLVKAVSDANPNTVLLVISSYPYAINSEDKKLPAIVYTSHAGPELGRAVAKTLSGANNPAARCPITWYKGVHQLPDIMDYDIIGNNSTYMYYDGEPLYPFGYGLSYSEFEYSDFAVTCGDSKITAELLVKNISDTDGDEVVQIYYKPQNPRVKRALRKLCGFKRVHIKAGETAKVCVEIPHSPNSALEFYDVTREKLCVEAGAYEFMAGASCLDIRGRCVVDVVGDTIPPRDLSSLTKAKNFDRQDNVKLEFTRKFSDTGEWYATTTEWGGFVTFDKAALNNYSHIEITAAAPYKTVGIDVLAGEKLLGNVEVLPSQAHDDFAVYKVALDEFEGVADFRLKLNGQLSVYGFRLL
ncbi:MAG: glycoside hydrolase family 3 C-terminal domain-containing protein [Oscillospiraceae bacterium]|nr:glycoside hydrolase family 3 C-terminal domain-containing protein [Oscillospiraceae bacterium]